MRVLISSGGTQAKYELGSKLDQGGAGAIFPVVGNPEWVAKVYMVPHTDRIDYPKAAVERERVEAMLESPPSIQAPHKGIYHQLAWPVGIIEDTSQRTLGFVMPRLPLDQACDLEALLIPDSRRREGLPEDYRVRVFAGYNLALLIRSLHKQGHHVIDMKPKNMSIYKLEDMQGVVALLDTDGFSIKARSGKRFPAGMFSSEYFAPELLVNGSKSTEADEYQDRWALAVIIFQLLNNGIHPYTGIYRGAHSPTLDDHVKAGRYAYGRVAHPEMGAKPGSMHEYLDDDTRVLFDRAFGTSRYARPTAKEWRDHLKEFVTPNSPRMVNCTADHNHWHFSKGCQLCALERLLSSRSGAAKGKTPATQVAVPTTPRPVGTANAQRAPTPASRQNRVQPTHPATSQQLSNKPPPSTPVPLLPTANTPPKSDRAFKLHHLLMLLGVFSAAYYVVNREPSRLAKEVVPAVAAPTPYDDERVKTEAWVVSTVEKFNSALISQSLDEAKTLLAEMRSKYPQDSRIDQMDRQFDSAMQAYDTLLREGAVHIRSGRWDEAKAVLDRLSKMSPTDPNVSLMREDLETMAARSSRVNVDSSDFSSTLRALESSREP